jgi:hypothetical protein
VRTSDASDTEDGDGDQTMLTPERISFPRDEPTNFPQEIVLFHGLQGRKVKRHEWITSGSNLLDFTAL